MVLVRYPSIVARPLSGERQMELCQRFPKDKLSDGGGERAEEGKRTTMARKARSEGWSSITQSDAWQIQGDVCAEPTI